MPTACGGHAATLPDSGGTPLTLPGYLERGLAHRIDTRYFTVRIKVVAQGCVVAGAGNDLRRSRLGGAGAGYIRQSHPHDRRRGSGDRSEEHTSELQSLMRISYADFCL